MADETSRELKDAEREYASILSQLSNEYADVKNATNIYQQDLQFLRETTSRIAVAQQALVNGQVEYKNANGKTVNVQKSLNSLLVEKTRKEAEMAAHLRKSIVVAGDVARVDKEQMSLAKKEMEATEAKIRQEKESQALEQQRLAAEKEAILERRLTNRGFISAQQGMVAGLREFEPGFNKRLEGSGLHTEELNSEYKRVAAQLKGDYDEVSATTREITDTQTSLAENARRILVARQALERGDEQYVNAGGELVSVEQSLQGLLNERLGIEKAHQDYMKQRMSSLSSLMAQEKAEAARKATAAADAAKQAAQDKAAAEAKRAADEAATKASYAMRTLMTKLGVALIDLVDAIYKVQQDVGIQMGSATSIYANALLSRAKSLVGIGGGPILNVQEIVDATANFKKEFGTILDPEEAARIAGEAKRLGVSSSDYVKAKRAFLGTGTNEDVVRQKAIKEFQKQGLAGADAIQFAAQNADLLAVAGGKYAESLFRAAAESKKIGVNLRDIEKFANSIVGDFEGSLENFAELSALGVEMDFNQLAQVAATGTPEEMQNLLQDQLSQSGITGEELQRNRQLRLALTQTTGMDESTLLKLAGVAQAPKEKTVEEQQVDLLSKILERLSGIATIGFAIAGAIGTLRLIQVAMTSTKAAGGAGVVAKKVFGFGGGGTPTPTPPTVPPQPTIPGSATPAAPAGGGNLAGTASGASAFSASNVLKGAAAMLVVAASVYVLAKGLQQFATVKLEDMGKAALALGVLTGAAFGLSFIAPAIGVGALAIAALGASIIPFGIALRIMAPGLSTFGQFITTLSQLNAGQVGVLALMGPALISMAAGLTALGVAAIVAAPGLAILGGLQKMGLLPTLPGAPTKTEEKVKSPVTTAPPVLPQTKLGESQNTEQKTQPVQTQPITKIDTTRLEEKLDKLINSMRGMKVEMNGYEVGHVAFNEARTPLRTR